MRRILITILLLMLSVRVNAQQQNFPGGSSSSLGSGGASLPTTNLIAQCALTDGSGTTPNCGSSTGWTFGSGLTAPSWNVPLASDNFINSVLGPYWTVLAGTVTTTANTYRAASGAGFIISIFNNQYNSTFSNDQWAQETATSGPGSGSGGPGVRVAQSGTNQNGYFCANNSTTAVIISTVSGVLNTIASTARTPAAGDILRIQAVGSTISCTLTTSAGVVTTLSVTDTNLTFGLPGLVSSNPFPNSPSMTNFQAGNVTNPAGGGLWFSGGQFVTAPASLNTAREIYIYACYQRGSNANLYNALIQGNGNGSATNALGLVLTGQPNTSNGPISQQVPHVSILTGSGSFGMIPFSNLNGCGVASVTYGTTSDRTFDGSFVNGQESIYTNNARSQSGGLQTVGAYQLGGTAAGSGFATASFLTGAIYYVAAYSAPNDVRTKQQIVQAITQAVVNRGGPAPSSGDTAHLDTILHMGDSITNGFGVTNGNVWSQNLTHYVPANGTTFVSAFNQGVTATTCKQLDQDFSIDELPLFSPGARNAVTVWCGTNDMLTSAQCGATVTNSCYGATAGQVWQSMKHYVDQIRTAYGIGVTVVGVNMISRSTNGSTCDADTNKDAFNPVFRQYASTIFDGWVDIASDPAFADTGCTGAAYNADKIHPNDFGHVNLLAPRIQRELNTIYGNHDFSSANTYTTTSTAGVATTAGTSSGQTATITMAATQPWAVGQCVIVAGVTPAGYNTAANQCALVRTATSTQITYLTAGSNLGAISVQGTVQAPQELDQDQYAILGGSAAAPNHILQTCLGRIGHTIYRQITNTNASPWTITSQFGETINGGASFTTPVASATNHPVIALKAILTSNTAGGCTWQASVQ